MQGGVSSKMCLVAMKYVFRPKLAILDHFKGRWCKVVQGGARWCKVVQDGARWCKVVQGGARWCNLVGAKRITDHQKIGGFPDIYYIAKKSLKCQKSPFPKISKLSGVKIFNFPVKNQRT